MPKSPKYRLLFFALIVVGLGSLLAAGYLFAQEEYVIYDGTQPAAIVSGNFQTVGDVLTAAGIEMRPEDLVRPSHEEPPGPQTAIQIIRAQPVILRTDEGTQTLFTQQQTIAAFLNEIGMLPQRTEQIFADGKKVAFNALDAHPLPHTLELGRFVTISIENGSQRQTLRTATQTVGDAIQEAGITLYGADGVEPALGSWLEPDMTIQIQRSFPLTIKVDGRTISTRSHHTNALDAVAEAGIGLVGYDYTVPGPDIPLRADAVIQVIRVTEDFRLEDKAIPFQTVWQASAQLDIDTQALVSAGVPGIKRQRVRIRYENGIPVSETVDGEWVARQPVNEVIGYGTNIVIRTLDTPEGPLAYWRVVKMRVTSYTAASSGKAPGDPGYGITASGLPAGKGVVAIDRNVVPWKSWVYVPGYGSALAGDTGGGVRGRWIDLGFEEEIYEGWSGYVDVYYLTPVPDPDDINYILPTALP